MRFLLLTGLSGAGKSTAARYLEDMGVFCVDNLPPMMIRKFMEACDSSGLTCPAVAFSVDVRSGAFFDANAVVQMMAALQPLGYQMEILFLEASDQKLLDRYKETRREHPLQQTYHTLEDSIAAERNVLMPLREIASHVIDTSSMKAKVLKDKLQKIVSGTETASFHVQVMSFGFKRGIPREADLVYDVRFLPNPFYIPELCRNSGLDDNVRDFVLGHAVTQEFLAKVTDLLRFLIPHYQQEGKHRLVIAIGCTGGAHRSVAITEAIGKALRESNYSVETLHRDIEIEQAHWLTDAL